MPTGFEPHPSLTPRVASLTAAELAEYDARGFLVIRNFLPPTFGWGMMDEAVELVSHIAAGDETSAVVMPEANLAAQASRPEQYVSKVFRVHAHGAFRWLAHCEAVTGIVEQIIGPDIDCWSSQFIFKNPGAWGQPWHQDSYYFPFMPERPIVAVWLAISRATPENGCLQVLAGSHREPLHKHHLPTRPNSNVGYREILDYDTSTAQTMEMKPGDLLVFDSFLMHQSTDNLSQQPRAAIVYHYARAGTVDRSRSILYEPAPVRRSSRPC